MQRKATVLISTVLLATVIFFSGCCPSCKIDESYTVPEGQKYRCEGFGIVEAQYYSPVGSGHHFVHLLMPDGKEHILPQAISASGARYTDDEGLLWWIKGDSAILEVRDKTGAWQTVSDDCRVEKDW